MIIDGLRDVGISFLVMRDYSGGIPYLEEARDLARSSGDSTRLDLAMSALAECYRFAGNFAAAESIYRELLHSQSGDNAHGRAIKLCSLAMLLIATARPGEARTALAEARSLTQKLGYKGLVGCATDVGAALAASLGQHATAARLHGAMLRQMEEAGVCHEPGDEAFFASWIARSRSALGDSGFEAAQAGGRALMFTAAMAELDLWLAATDAAP